VCRARGRGWRVGKEMIKGERHVHRHSERSGREEGWTRCDGRIGGRGGRGGLEGGVIQEDAAPEGFAWRKTGRMGESNDAEYIAAERQSLHPLPFTTSLFHISLLPSLPPSFLPSLPPRRGHGRSGRPGDGGATESLGAVRDCPLD